MPVELWVKCDKCGTLCKGNRLLDLHKQLAHSPKPEFIFEPANIMGEEKTELPHSKWKKRNIV